MQPSRAPQGALPWIGTLARLVTGGVWVVAGAIKLPDPYESISAVRAYQALPEAVVPLVGHLLPIVEVVVGVMLILGVLTRWAGLASAVLFAVFIVGIASVWMRGIEIDCGCFGGGGAKEGAMEDYPKEIARDVGLLLASAWLVWRPRTRLAVDNLLFRSSERAPERNEDGEERPQEEHAGQPG
ncbi:DoxX family membrane protein [Nocardioides sp. Y6]|uniref:DoxX family membrane protein n=1 Tax=Nocardioides malaquae TaxID=2773426 RepID=A0ABR9RQ83_9ACTN|nr:MauE/DoxX family redox-associated membrane protein [Nocardioides malaquae]MBE7323729.1 DoxX family membrane protein [Nocardioides malaquae]